MDILLNSIRARRMILSLAVGCGAFIQAHAAHAVDCNTLANPSYGLGGSAQRPLIARLATKLVASTPAVTIVHQAPGACNGINAIIGSTRMTGTATYWNSDGTEATCTLPLTGQAVEWANMGNSAPSCPGVAALPSDIGDFLGPITPYNVIVPIASSQQSISSEGVYFVWGFGAQSQLSPWTDETQIFRRDANSTVTLFLSIASTLPPDRFRGIDVGTNGAMITRLAGATTAEAAIGYVSGEVADANRSRVRTLAYQHTGQRCAYWPDSTATTFDKRNVRNGTYWLWAPNHFYAKIGTDGVITNPRTRALLGYLTGEVAPPSNLDIVREEILSGNIPVCAMNVRRTGDLGLLQSYQPSAPCGCFFESIATGQTPTNCTPCTDNTSCAGNTPVCRSGFCEVR